MNDDQQPDSVEPGPQGEPASPFAPPGEGGPGADPAVDAVTEPDQGSAADEAVSEPSPAVPSTADAVPDDGQPLDPAVAPEADGTPGPPVAAGDEAAPKRYGLRIALGAVGAVALAGAIWFGVSQISSSGSSGSDSPEDAVAALFDAIEQRDVVGALETVDPAERESVGEGLTDVLDELVRLEVLDQPAAEPGVPGFTIEFDDLEFTSEAVADDIADVSVTGGTVTTSVTPSELPVGQLLRENGVDPAAMTETSSAGEPVGLDDVVFATVERDGGWYVSLWYSVAENARLDAGLPMPDAADAPEPVGADSPGEAVQAMIDAVTALDVRTMIGMLDPAEASALYRYSPLFLPDAEAAVAQLPEFDLSIAGLEYPTEQDGDRAIVQVEPGDEVTIEASVPSEDVAVSAVLSADGMTAHLRGGGQEVEIATDDYECYDVQADGRSETVCASDLEDAEQFGAQLGALQGLEWPFAPEVMDKFSAAYGGAGIATVERDGRWYLSPTHTLFDLSLRGVRALEADDIRTLIDQASTFDVEEFEQSLGPAFAGLEGSEQGVPTDDPDDLVTDEPVKPVTDPAFELDWLALNAGRDLTAAEQACLTPLVEERLAAEDYDYDAAELLGECGITATT